MFGYGRFSFRLNPGPWNMKEHGLIALVSRHWRAFIDDETARGVCTASCEVDALHRGEAERRKAELSARFVSRLQDRLRTLFVPPQPRSMEHEGARPYSLGQSKTARGVCTASCEVDALHRGEAERRKAELSARFGLVAMTTSQYWDRKQDFGPAFGVLYILTTQMLGFGHCFL
jgi:ferredoxin